MSELIATSARCAIVGMGQTGHSLARYCHATGIAFDLFDSRPAPPLGATLAADYPVANCYTGAFDGEQLGRYERLLMSPGVACSEPAIVAAKAAGAKLSGDAQLFFDAARAPVVAITGSNGKSTVTSLVGAMAEQAGLRVAVGGNLGTPMLDLLDDSVELYVVELSSFQLELLDDCRGAIVALLNISPDHMDRYPDLNRYRQAKQRIYAGARVALSNRADPLTAGLHSAAVIQLRFGLAAPDLRDWGVAEHDGEPSIYHGLTPIIALHQLPLRGAHNIANGLAALALGTAAGLELAPMLEALRQFKGLPHRCELVAERNGVLYINDSKATNVGAAVAAIEGLAAANRANLLLLAGGDGKGQSFEALAGAARGRVRHAALFGRDAARLGADLAAGLAPEQMSRHGALAEALAALVGLAQPGDTVLLAPACASFDQYPGFAARGEQFRSLVLGGGL